MTNKQKYIQLLKEHDVHIFMQDWWLDSVCSKDWDVFLYKKDGKILAALPYNINKTFGFTTIIPALLSPISGMFIDYSDCGRLSEKYSLENTVMEAFAEFIDKTKPAYFNYQLAPENFFWTGMYWHGFNATVHYTYKVDISDMEQCFANFLPVMRKNLRRAERLLTIETENICLKDIYNDLLLTTYKKQGTKIPYSFEIFEKIVLACEKNGSGKLFVAKDSQQKAMGTLLIVWDKTTCYNLVSGMLETKEQNYAVSFLTYKAMQYANALGIKDFDMEGSMLRNIEHYFRFFSGTRTPYLIIEKKYSKTFQFLKKLKRLLR